MFAYDVNGDGKNDIITSLQAHGYGVAWFEQVDDGGAVGWNQHIIVGKNATEGETGIVFSQPHALDLVDMNGDGLKDLVTGKRFWAHGPDGDPEPKAWPVLYWFELKRDGGKAKWTAHLIDSESGVGTQVIARD
ncbi:VCBS repeat-containing protein, partial [Pseudomonas sp. RGM 3321]|uniref:FG-GAP repeat domain-containing protein n=1 Tax=Pseudomonas sp. RGM 3321 TaxID=2930089 RepID=UPI001FCC8F41